MQVAAFLSDLRSLSVCSHESAIGLVQTYKSLDTKNSGGSIEPAQGGNSNLQDATKTTDQDLQRADELVSLHQNVKLKHIQTGQDQELLQARQVVQSVLASLARSL